jgi:hypothetical protein
MWNNYPSSFENKLKDALNNNYTKFSLKIKEEKYMITSNKCILWSKESFMDIKLNTCLKTGPDYPIG